MRWDALVRGPFPIGILGISSDRASVYVTESYSLAASTVRLLRLALADGSELASVRLRAAARCVAFDDGTGDLLAATDSRLFRLDRIRSRSASDHPGVPATWT